MLKTKTIEQLFKENKGRVCHKWVHYLAVYDRFFSSFQDKPVNVLEIGVSHGGSLQIWSKYFHPGSNIVGVDIEPLCKSIEGGNIKIFTGSQTDRSFMESLPYEFDIIIDDGSHMQPDVRETFNIMFPRLKKGGIYVTEDLHTAYWKEYGGGLRKMGTFIEDVKWLIDDVNGYHIKEPGYPCRYTKEIRSIFITDSMVIIQKGDVPAPHAEVTGIKGIYPLGNLTGPGIIKPSKETVQAIDLSELHKLTISGRSVEFLNGEPGKEHYKLLAWISTHFNKINIAEVGTLDGCGALALSFNTKNKVTTWDIRLYDDCSNFPANVQRKLVNDNYLDEVVKSKVILYDTMHDGVLEREFIAALVERKWKGILILDDIYLYQCMADMWKDITLRKEDWTDLGHWSGTGIVFFD